MRIDELCTRKVAVANPEDTVEAASRRMRDEGVGSLVVVDGLERPLGILTDRDVVLRCVAERRDAGHTRLGELMSGPAAWIRADASADKALDEMERLRLRRLPVVDARDRLVGIVSLDDLLLSQVGADSALGRALRASLARPDGA